MGTAFLSFTAVRNPGIGLGVEQFERRIGFEMGGDDTDPDNVWKILLAHCGVDIHDVEMFGIKVFKTLFKHKKVFGKEVRSRYIPDVDYFYQIYPTTSNYFCVRSFKRDPTTHYPTTPISTRRIKPDPNALVYMKELLTYFGDPEILK